MKDWLLSCRRSRRSKDFLAIITSSRIWRNCRRQMSSLHLIPKDTNHLVLTACAKHRCGLEKKQQTLDVSKSIMHEASM